MPGLYNKSIKMVISNGQSPISVFQKMTEVSCIRKFEMRLPSLFVQDSIKQTCGKIFGSLFNEEITL